MSDRALTPLPQGTAGRSSDVASFQSKLCAGEDWATTSRPAAREGPLSGWVTPNGTRSGRHTNAMREDCDNA